MIPLYGISILYLYLPLLVFSWGWLPPGVPSGVERVGGDAELDVGGAAERELVGADQPECVGGGVDGDGDGPGVAGELGYG